jgi:hypothetical protein
MANKIVVRIRMYTPDDGGVTPKNVVIKYIKYEILLNFIRWWLHACTEVV